MAQNTLQFTINLGGNAYTGIAQIDRALNNININAKKTEKLFDRITNATFKFNNVMQATQMFAEKVSNVIGKVIDVGGENELQKINMVTLFRGNALAAEDMYKKIKQYGKDTVYENKGLIEGISTMMQYQISGEKAFKTLKQIGDIAMGDAAKMQSLTLAFSQATAAGKLQGNDYKQMIGAGFNPLLTISEKTGESIASLEAKMSKGAISAEMLSQAFAWATEEGGAFYNGAANAGQTTIGKINEFKESVDDLLIHIFNQLKPVIDSCIEFASNFLNKVPAIFGRIRSAISALAMPVLVVTSAFVAYKLTILSLAAVQSMIAGWKAALAAYEIVVFAVKNSTSLWTAAQWLLNVALSANPIGLIIAAVAALVAAIVYVCTKIQGWGSLWDGICGFMKHTFFAFVENFKSGWTAAVNGFMIGIDKIKLGWYRTKLALGIGDESATQAAIRQINADVEARQKAIVDSQKKVAEHVNKAKESLAGIEMSWGSDEKKESSSAAMGTNSQLQSLVSASTGGAEASANIPSLGKSNEAIATGGTRNTSITINLGEMIGSVSYNGGFEENREDFERKLAESMFRVLAIAQTSVG